MFYMVNDHGVNLSDFLPNPKRLSQIFEHPTHTKEKWGETIRAEISGLFDSGTYSFIENPLPADEVIPTKSSMNKKLNWYGGTIF